MYYCERCKEFIEPNYDTNYEKLEYFGRPVERETHEATCPICGSDNIEEVSECKCGNPCYPHEEYCDECHTEVLNNMIKARKKLNITVNDIEQRIYDWYEYNQENKEVAIMTKEIGKWLKLMDSQVEDCIYETLGW